MNTEPARQDVWTDCRRLVARIKSLSDELENLGDNPEESAKRHTEIVILSRELGTKLETVVLTTKRRWLLKRVLYGIMTVLLRTGFIAALAGVHDKLREVLDTWIDNSLT